MRICPGCRSRYDESVHVCEKDGLPLLDVSPTFAAIKGDEIPETPARGRADQTLAPGMMVGEYMIERTIAEGGMGHVYAGIHPVISKRVAIKVLSKRFASDAKAISRFVLEARSVNQIGHHNIVDIFSIGELDDGRNYLIMELLDGLPMHEVLRNVKRFKVGEILPVYQQLCDALEAAHEKSFVHRDLKPDNVVVLRRPPHPFIKILDFGIAKLRGSSSGQENTEVGTVLGTPEYMAPEQCRGGQIDARVDIYALGVMLYELVTGRKPFTDPNPLRILSKQMREQPVPPSRLAPIPKALELVILKAMAKDPASRHRTVRELLDALAAATPELLPWRANLERPTRKPPQDQVRTIPPDSAQPVAPVVPRRQVARPPRPRQVSVPAPVSISDSIDTSAEADDEEQTLVSEPKVASPGALAPMPMQGVTTGELDDEATAVNPVERPNLANKTPPPAFGRANSAELRDSASTIVEDEEPVMLVDRPMEDVVSDSALVQSTRGQISSTYEPPATGTPPTPPTNGTKKKQTGPPIIEPRGAPVVSVAVTSGPLRETASDEQTGERILPNAAPDHATVPMPTLRFDEEAARREIPPGPIEPGASFQLMVEINEPEMEQATLPLPSLVDRAAANFEDSTMDVTGPIGPRGGESPILLTQKSPGREPASAADSAPAVPPASPGYPGRFDLTARSSRSARKEPVKGRKGGIFAFVVVGALLTAAAAAVGVAYYLGYLG
jgi:serine/threonine protein kinase